VSPEAGAGDAGSAADATSDSAASDALSSSGCSGSWASGKNMTVARTGMTTAVAGGHFYVLGGATGGATAPVESYDPTTDTWTTESASTTARAYASAGTINDKIYLVGGCINSDCGGGLTDLLEEYDPQSDSWTTKQPMPTARTTMAGGVVNGKFYLAGGMQQCGPCNPMATLEVYDPTTDAWASLSPMPHAASHTSAAVLNGKLYVIGGDDFFNGSGLPSPDPLNAVQVYDPTLDQWSSPAAPLPTARSSLATDALGALIFAVSGQVADGSVPPLVEVYDPAPNSWCTGVPIPNPHYLARCNALGASLYCVGGSAANTPLATLDIFTPSP
jgi:N-acetylneuraminic acid mutarotase